MHLCEATTGPGMPLLLGVPLSIATHSPEGQGNCMLLGHNFRPEIL
jgi:hypothetical protein